MVAVPRRPLKGLDMTNLMRGLRVLEVAQFRFVSAARDPQFNCDLLVTGRVPEASKHIDLVLTEMGMESDHIPSRKESGTVA